MVVFHLRPYVSILALLLAILVCSVPAIAQLSVTLTPNIPAPQPVGATVTWTAKASGGTGPYDYRFTTTLSGSSNQIRRDYSNNPKFFWTPASVEGTYTIGVTARDRGAGTSTSTTADYMIVPALSPSGHAAVHSTNNTLVALFSAPACSVGNSMRVAFHASGSQMYTPAQACPGLTSMNFYIAGMYPNTTYNVFWQTLNSSGVVLSHGSTLTFTTGAIPASVALPTAISINPSTPPDEVNPILWHGYVPRFGTHYSIAASDLYGNFLWYLPYPVSFAPHNEQGGNMLILQTAQQDPTMPAPYAQIAREVDLAGNTVVETNAEIVSEQLVALGTRPINGFHHEARRLPNGNLLLMAANEELVTNAAQCGTTDGNANTCDVIGDEVLVLNSNLQLLWAWDAFDATYTDANGVHNLIDRPAVLGETCTQGQSGCPPFFLAPWANDWLHGNALQLTADGNILISMRHQDWVMKLNYSNGAGDGHIMWRLGLDGDFALTTVGTKGSADLGYPWFSHQHEAEIALGGKLFNGSEIFTVFDNGNTRLQVFNSMAHSRGQVYAINEKTLTANLNLNSDLGSYSYGHGAAEILPSGNFHFCNGWIGGLNGPNYTQDVETDNNGNIVYYLQTGDGTAQNTTIEYRSYRQADLYTLQP